MSFPYSVQAPVPVLSVGAEEAGGPSHFARGRGDVRDQPSAFGLACRDVMDEARLRMARRGYPWD